MKINVRTIKNSRFSHFGGPDNIVYRIRNFNKKTNHRMEEVPEA